MLKEHRRKDDAWTAINGKVYNMTPYLPYHPGGEKELMRVAGRDGTKLFGELYPPPPEYPTKDGFSSYSRVGIGGDDDGCLYGRVPRSRLTLIYHSRFEHKSIEFQFSRGTVTPNRL